MRWKWFAAIGVLIIVILIAAVYGYLNTYDYNRLKPLVARRVEDATGRKLTLGGEVNLAIGFSPALVVTQVALANVSWGSQPQMIEIEKLQVEVRLLPLLLKNVEVKHIRLAGVKVLLETGPDDRNNWDFLAGNNSAGSSGALRPTALSVDQLSIENLQLAFRRDKTGVTKQFNLASLELAGQGAEDAVALSLKADYNGQPLTLAGKIGNLRHLIAHQRFPLQLTGKFSNAAVRIDGAIEDVLNLDGIDLKAQASGVNLEELRLDPGIKLPKTNTFEVAGHLMGSKESLVFKDVSGNMSLSGVDLVFNGIIGDLIALSGVDLKLTASGKDLEELGGVLGEKLPASDQFDIRGRLTGSTAALTLQGAQGNASRGSMRLSLTGSVKDLLTLKGLDLQSRLSGKNLEELGGVFGEKLPASDQFDIRGRLTGSTAALTLQGAQGNASRGSMRLSLTGSVKDLLTLKGLDLQSRLSGKNLEELGGVFGEKLPASDQFDIRGRLTGSTAALTLTEAEGRAGRGSLNLTVNGGVEELLKAKGLNVRLKASGKEFAEIGPLFGTELPKLGPFDLGGKLSGSAKAISLSEFSAMVDKSDFNGRARVEFLKRPKITARLESSLIDFTALMKSTEQDQPKPANKNKQKRRLFSDDPLPFDALEKVDADIVLNAKNLQARDARFKFGHLSLKLEDSNLSIDNLEAVYKETKISGNFQLDPGSPPRIVTRFLVQNLDLGGLLKETGVSDKIRSTVDIAAHLNGRGDSVHSLMADLTGSMGVVMGEGFLSKYLDLLSMNLSLKVVQFWGHHQKAEQIRCAVVQFDFNSGIATSQAFVFDTGAGILTGEGKINLDTEKINFLLVPKPAYPSLSLSTNLRVDGSLMDPRVSPDKLALLEKGAWALSSLVVGPLGLLAPFVHLGANKKHPCNIQSIGQLGLKSPGSE